jgi:hypothetical protein
LRRQTDNPPLGLLALIAAQVLIPKQGEISSWTFDFRGFLLGQLTFLCVAVIAGIALLDNLRLPPKAGESVLRRT